MKKEKSCGAVVYKKEGNKNIYLAVKSIRDGHWGFAKGHVEKGESETDTATREIMEETNINANLLDGFRIEKHYSPYKNVEKEVVFFIANSSKYNIKIQEEEIEDYKFAPFNEVYGVLTYESDKDVLKKVDEFLKEKEN